MKLVLAISLLFFILHGSAQYYLRGEVKDEKGRLLPDVKICLRSKGAITFQSGISGSFGIPVPKKTDSVTLSLDGYETLSQLIDVTGFKSFVLQQRKAGGSAFGSGLMSFTKNLFTDEEIHTITNGAETYNTLVENDFIKTSQAAETGLSLNINCASYSNIRRFINMQSVVPPDGVRIEEMLNYFNLGSTAAGNNASDFLCNTQLTSCPWNAKNKLLFVQLQAPKLNLKEVPPANLTFLIDVSGSMDKDNRLPLVQYAFKLLAQNLRTQDTVAIVTYGGHVGVALQPVSGAEKNKINSVIDSLQAEGDTPGSAAIQTAYLVAERLYNPGSNNRVILATDGDFNVGQTSEKELQAIVAAHKQSGIYLTCLGVGMGNYKDSKLEALATNGNGNFAYIDNVYEAQKTLMAEFTKNMYTVASDAYLDVEFNKQQVAAYRLIGFDNKKNDLAEKSTRIEGGEIGSGHSMIAVFEITPATPFATDNTNVATLHLRYNKVVNHTPQVQQFNVTNNTVPFEAADEKLRFATALTMFGSLLKNSKYAEGFNWDTVHTIAAGSLSAGNVLEGEFISLVDKAKHIYSSAAEVKKKK